MGDRHRLEINLARACDERVKQAFASEQHVFETPDHLDIKGACCVHHCQNTGVADKGFAGGEIVLNAVAVHLKEDKARPGDAFHDEALAAEKARAEPLSESGWRARRRWSRPGMRSSDR